MITLLLSRLPGWFSLVLGAAEITVPAIQSRSWACPAVPGWSPFPACGKSWPG